MRTERALVGTEYDALTGWRHVMRWRPGERKTIKRGHSRRVRRTARAELRRAAELDDEWRDIRRGE